MGGAETLVVNLMPRFRAMGHEVGVAVFDGQKTALMDRLERECPECKIYRLGKSVYSPLHIVRLAPIMRQYDIVHTHNSSPQLFAAIANIVCQKKLVTTEHSTNNRKRERGGILRMVDKWMYKRYDKIICISEVAESKLKTYIASPQPSPKGKGDLMGDIVEKQKVSVDVDVLVSKICTINNGVDVEAIHVAEPITEMRSGMFVIVMVAGFREAKDQDTLIRAMELLPKEEYELWLVGDGVRRSELELKIENGKLKNNVRMLGLRTDVPRILKTADVVVMSSHWEGMSLSNIEGMSAGKPFVASNVNGLREVTQGYGILFPHEDAEALARIIQRLHNDSHYYQEVADRCYERAKEFDIQKMVNAYINVYNQFFV